MWARRPFKDSTLRDLSDEKVGYNATETDGARFGVGVGVGVGVGIESRNRTDKKMDFEKNLGSVSAAAAHLSPVKNFCKGPTFFWKMSSQMSSKPAIYRKHLFMIINAII